MNQGSGIPAGLFGVPDLDYEVTVEVRNKKTGAKNRMYYPNVGAVNADHQLTRECAGLEKWGAAGMPQTLFLMVGFNASPRTGKTVEIREGGAMAERMADDVATGIVERDAETDGK